MFRSQLFVGNLKYDATADQLRELFSQHGEVVEAHVIPGRGFGFVKMKTVEDAEKAREALDGAEFEHRKLEVAEAKDPHQRRDKEEFKFKRHYQIKPARRE